LQTFDGNYAIAGTTGPSHDDNARIYLAKIDPEGNQLWSNIFGTTDLQRRCSGQQTSDGGFIFTGTVIDHETHNYDIYLIKADAEGNEVWNRRFGDSNADQAHSVLQTLDGGYIIAGSHDFYDGSSNPDIYVIKTDAEGNEEWSKRFGGPGNDWAQSIQHTLDGAYIVTGVTRACRGCEGDIYLLKIDTDGNELWSNTFDYGRDLAFSVTQTSDGGYCVLGKTEPSGGGDIDICLIKTDADGNEQWTKIFDYSDSDWAHCVQQTSDGGYIIAGQTYTNNGMSYDAYLIKTDTEGKKQWGKTYGGSDSDMAYSVQQTPDGGYIFTGHHGKHYNSFVSKIYVVKTDSNGNCESIP